MFCEGGRPPADHRIADLGATVAYLNDDQFFAGWTVLVLKRHAVELFDLDAAERARVVEEVSRVASVLQAAFDARKLNYASFGNQIPHMHWHVIPRLASDPAPLESPWNVPHAPVRLDHAALTTRIAGLRAGLGP
ncbi:MAG TPA: HIT family protein [Terriglobales bacterium]|nr:HIT family protein [Terriglobales bacterium]